MRMIQTYLPPALLAALLLCAASPNSVHALSPGNGQTPQTLAADNSGSNKGQDANADQQKPNPEDLATARKIRKSIIANKSLTTYAHNVKIIVVGGNVTLKGPVRSDDEKKEIGDLAAQVVGNSTKVENDITIAP